jgi:integrase
LLVDHLGGDADIRAVAAKDIAAYRDGLARLKLGHQIGPDKSFAARQTDDAGRRISSETVAVVLANVKSFFKWLVPEVLDSNPAQGISVTKPKCMKGVKKRRPFRADELETLFGSPLFTGCKSPKRRFEPGSHRVSDAYFWLPILAFYTGARIGELIQLHMSDVDVDCGLPHLWIREEGGGALGSGTEKHVKTEAGIRQVPLHPDVLALGFGKFVEQRRKQHGKRQRLFFEVKLGADGQASSVFSKWFARLLDKVGLKDPALVCHSFRHGMEDALRDTLAPQYLIDSIIGHTEGKTSDGYGDGPALEVCAELTS